MPGKRLARKALGPESGEGPKEKSGSEDPLFPEIGRSFDQNDIATPIEYDSVSFAAGASKSVAP